MVAGALAVALLPTRRYRWSSVQRIPITAVYSKLVS